MIATSGTSGSAQPQLESWDAGRPPAQLMLGAYLDVLRAALTPRLIGLGPELAIRLDVGLPATTDPLYERDLDNYIFPILARRCIAAERVASA